MVGEATTSSASDCSAVQHGWLSSRVQQTIEIVEPIYSSNLHTTGQACRRAVYLSAAEARFWLFMTSRRFSSCAEVWR